MTTRANHPSDTQDAQDAQRRTTRREALLRRVFRLSLVAKAAHSVLELAAGLALHWTSSDAIARAARGFAGHELLEHPDDRIAQALVRAAESFSVDQQAAAVAYLTSHGAVEIFLVAMILRERLWAYPLYMAALGLLIAYQGYQLALAFHLWLAALTLFDAAVVWLTWHEYRVRRALRRPG